MRYSLVNGVKSEPSPKATGICLCCGSETVAKCGRFKVHHWAHKNKADCDPWWENESEWHRNWKSFFPIESQEILFTDKITQEKHIADIYTTGGTVVEIQSYSIDDVEARTRETFYGNMVWIINGCTNTSNKIYFEMSLKGTLPEDSSIHNFGWIGRGKLFEKWLSATKAVYFDFGHNVIWQLLTFNPKTKDGQVKQISKQEFITSHGGVCT